MTLSNNEIHSQQLRKRFGNQLLRIGNLINDGKFIHDDQHRLLLVFIHAVFEDMLREIIRLRWQFGNTEWLESLNIPNKKRKVKFTIKDLHVLDGTQTIHELVSLSVDNKLDETSFSSIESICLWVDRLELNKAQIEKYLPSLKEGINLRHQIVHVSDLDQDTCEPNIFSKDILKKFQKSTGDFILELITQIENNK